MHRAPSSPLGETFVCVQGVKLTRQLMGEAGRALKQNITTLGPLVLPFSEQLLFFFNLIARKGLKLRSVRPYIPDFTLAFDHVCIHTGGRAVVEEIERQLRLPPALVAPSKLTLYRYGNTSSSSIWCVWLGDSRLTMHIRSRRPRSACALARRDGACVACLSADSASAHER